MNEKAEKLMDKAGFHLVMGTRQPIEKRDYVMSQEQMDKFLESVVKSCADIPTIMWGESLVNADIAVKIRNRILEEFEIEDED
jgi:hypothetical protein